MEHDSPHQLIYAKATASVHAITPARLSLACATLLPISYAFFRSSFAVVRIRPTMYFVLCGILLMSTVFAIGFAVIALRRARPERAHLPRIALVGLIAGILNAPLSFALHRFENDRYWENYSRDHAFMRCQSQLRLIGMGIVMYANENHGVFPMRIGDLLTDQRDGRELICPFTNDAPAVGPTTQSVANQLALPGMCSYVYVGGGLTSDTASPAHVVAYEPVSNHVGHTSTTNFLFADGRIERIPHEQATRIIRQLEAGTNPPTR